MKVLLLGTGMQGKAALHDLVESKAVTGVVAADADLESLERHAAHRGYGDAVTCVGIDASDTGALDALLARGFDVAINLLPVGFDAAVAAPAVRHHLHVVSSSYASPELAALGDDAGAAGVALLPEMGMDPGIDLVLTGEAVRSLDRVTALRSYGGGIPAPEAADNPLRYKVSWTFEGVLRSYHRAGRVVRDGKVREIGAAEQFLPENVHEVEVQDLGRLEAYPNGDAVGFAEALGLDPATLDEAGRYSLRYPGHCAFWRKLNALHLLDDEPVTVDGGVVDRRRYLAAVLEPQLRYGEDESDLGILRVEVEGEAGGRPGRIAYQVVDRRDPETGFTAMSRMVGYTTSIGAQMVGGGIIEGRGLLSPLHDVPFGPFVDALAARGITVSTHETDTEEA